MNNILILGAGPAGMSCAFALAEVKVPSTIIEKDSSVGGLAKTLLFNEENYVFRTDIGPHRFFSKNKKLYDIIESILGEDWVKVKRKTRQFIDGKFYDYPINAIQAFKNIGPVRAAKMAISYSTGAFKFRVLKKPILSFEDYIVAYFGKALGDFNMLNYTEKIWGIPCNKIHPQWAKQRIKGLNFASAIKNAIIKSENGKPKSLVDEFYYPRFGTGTIYSGMEKAALRAGSKIIKKSYPTKITHDGNKITSVIVNADGKEIKEEPKILVNTIPITDLLNLLSPSPPKHVMDAAKKLQWRNQVYLFVTLNKERITDDNWIYIPNKEIPFARFSEMKNFSKAMSPENKTSAIAEYFVGEEDRIWRMNEKELFEESIPWFEKLGFFTRAEVRNYYVVKKQKVYPVYDLQYQEHLKIIKNYLDSFSNLYYIGRPGRYRYNNQDHSIEMGLLAAEGILKESKPDFDSVGAEEEYYEKGEINNEKPSKN